MEDSKMKKLYFLLFLFILFAGFATAQNDTIYFMKSGAVIFKHSIREADIDSIIFYSPVSIDEHITDIDGNVYQTVKIGNQCWMAENLRTTKYRNGDAIPTTVPDNKDIAGETEPKYQWIYNRTTPQYLPYGRLYTSWYAATDARGIAPEGWHVATKADWLELTNYLIANGYNYDGTTAGNKIGKSLASKTLWNASGVIGGAGNDLSKNNSTGFNAYPGGYRAQDGFGNAYHNLGNCTQLWTSDEFDAEHGYSEHIGFDRVDLLLGTQNWKHLGLAIRCVKNKISCPILTTKTVTNIGQLTATSGSNITSDGGAPVTARGVCWSTSQNPTIAHSKTTDGTGTGEFSSSITGLAANTTYYVRAYATNSVGTCYGEEVSFKTKDYVVENCGTVTDIDGNVYQTVNIGGKCWMAENLRTTKYRNGDAIPNVTDGTTWTGLTSGAWCAYDNSMANAPTYGLLYNWYTVVDSRGLAPVGWHVASADEWEEMASYLIANGYNFDGTLTGNKIGKAVASTSNWWNNTVNGNVGNNQAQNNKAGLNIPPAGARHYTSSSFVVMGAHANIYTSTEYNAELARVIGLYFDGNYLNLSIGGGGLKYQGASVRCIKD